MARSAERSRPFPIVTPALVVVSALATVAPGLDGVLEYDRHAVDTGQVWRLVTGQLVHWTARMALADLGLLLVVGVWLEWRSSRILAGSLISAALLGGAGVHLLAGGLTTYRGSSGLGTAVIAAAALTLVRDHGLSSSARRAGAVALLLLAAKILWEARTGAALAAGDLPQGVAVTPVVHLIGAVCGLAVAAMTPPRLAPCR